MPAQNNIPRPSDPVPCNSPLLLPTQLQGGSIIKVVKYNVNSDSSQNTAGGKRKRKDTRKRTNKPASANLLGVPRGSPPEARLTRSPTSQRWYHRLTTKASRRFRSPSSFPDPWLSPACRP